MDAALKNLSKWAAVAAAWLATGFCALAGNVSAPVQDVGGVLQAHRRVTLTLVEPGPVTSGSWLVAGDSLALFTGTNGTATFSNVLAGTYSMTVAGSPARVFEPLLITNFSGTLPAAAFLVVSTNVPTVTGDNSALTANAANARFMQNPTNSPTDGYVPTATGAQSKWAAGGGSGSATNAIDVAPGFGIGIVSNVLAFLRTISVDTNVMASRAFLNGVSNTLASASGTQTNIAFAGVTNFFAGVASASIPAAGVTNAPWTPTNIWTTGSNALAAAIAATNTQIRAALANVVTNGTDANFATLKANEFWSDQIKDSSGAPRIDLEEGTIFNPDGQSVISLSQRQLADQDEDTSVDWQNRTLNRHNQDDPAMKWEYSFLISAGGITNFSWAMPWVSGNGQGLSNVVALLAARLSTNATHLFVSPAGSSSNYYATIGNTASNSFWFNKNGSFQLRMTSLNDDGSIQFGGGLGLLGADGTIGASQLAGTIARARLPADLQTNFWWLDANGYVTNTAPLSILTAYFMNMFITNATFTSLTPSALMATDANRVPHSVVIGSGLSYDSGTYTLTAAGGGGGSGNGFPLTNAANAATYPITNLAYVSFSQSWPPVIPMLAGNSVIANSNGVLFAICKDLGNNVTTNKLAP